MTRRAASLFALALASGCGWEVVDPFPREQPSDARVDAAPDAGPDVAAPDAPPDAAPPPDIAPPDIAPPPDAPPPDAPPPDVALTDGPADAPADAPGCPPGRTLCNGACVDTQTDVDHCGRCGNACPSTARMLRSCQGGACGAPRCLADCMAVPPPEDAGCGPPLGSNEACGSCAAGARACDTAAGYACQFAPAVDGGEAFRCCRSLPACGAACRPGDVCETDGDGARCCQR